MDRHAQIDRIRTLPDRLEALVGPLTDEQLTTAYIPGEWTVAQNIHHLVDSHSNSIIRMKLILTEDYPTLKPYDQDAWAELPDATGLPVTTSLTLLRAMHARWVVFLEAIAEEDWSRTGYHPENDEDVSLDDLVEHYAWHGDAHIAQIEKTLAAGNE